MNVQPGDLGVVRPSGNPLDPASSMPLFPHLVACPAAIRDPESAAGCRLAGQATANRSLSAVAVGRPAPGPLRREASRYRRRPGIGTRRDIFSSAPARDAGRLHRLSDHAGMRSVPLEIGSGEASML